MEGSDINKTSNNDGAADWDETAAGDQQRASQTDGSHSAPPSTLQFESQSVATSLGYITNPVARPASPEDGSRIAEYAPDVSHGDPRTAATSFEFSHSGHSASAAAGHGCPNGQQEPQVPLTAPVDRGFDVPEHRFSFPSPHMSHLTDSQSGDNRRSPFLPPFRQAYSMPDRSFHGRSPSPALQHASLQQHQQPHSAGPQSLPEPQYGPTGNGPYIPSHQSYHYAPQSAHPAHAGGGPDIATPRMPPFTSAGPQGLPADAYYRSSRAQGPMPAYTAPQPQQPYHLMRPMMLYPPQQQQQHPMSMPPPIHATPQHQPPGSAVMQRPRGMSHGSDEHDGHPSPGLERALTPVTSKPTAQNQGTPFISKLMHLLSNDRYSAYIRWNSAGDAFILSHTNQYFASQVLPLYFRHSNTSSFIRQLNLYQFQRLPIMQLLETLDDGTSGALAGATAPSSCFSGFSHPLFKRDQEELSYMIKPKPGKVRDRSAAAVAARKAKQDTDAPSPVAGALEPPTSLSARPNDIYKSDPGRMVSGGNSSIGPGGSGSNGSQPKGVRRSKRFVSEQQQQQPLEHSDGFEPDMSSSQMMFSQYPSGVPAGPQ